MLVGAAACSPVISPESESRVTRGDNPVSVVEAYFSAWERQDWAYQRELVDTDYVIITPEPVTAIRSRNVFPKEGDSQQAVCEAVFELGVPGEGATVKTGKHTWKFYLQYYEDRNKFVITGIQTD